MFSNKWNPQKLYIISVITYRVVLETFVFSQVPTQIKSFYCNFLWGLEIRIVWKLECCSEEGSFTVDKLFSPPPWICRWFVFNVLGLTEYVFFFILFIFPLMCPCVNILFILGFHWAWTMFNFSQKKEAINRPRN